MSHSDSRYRLTIGHPIEGEEREYKTLVGARRAGRRLRDQGCAITLWEGTLRRWGGWSWSSIDLDPPDEKELRRTGIKRRGRSKGPIR